MYLRVQKATVTDVYFEKYKGISLALAMLSRALNGSYVNFGVFDLYKDPALHSALDAAMQMALSVPNNNVIAYAKSPRRTLCLLKPCVTITLPPLYSNKLKHLLHLWNVLVGVLCPWTYRRVASVPWRWIILRHGCTET